MSSKAKKAKKLAKKMAKQAAAKKAAPKKKQVKKLDTWKKKDWYVILAPKMFEEKQLFETPALKPENVIGRVVEVPLRDLTGKMQHMATILKFKVTEVKGKTAYTECAGFEILRDELRRDIRRRRSIITTILSFTTSDQKKVRLTMFVFTAQKIDTKKQKELRRNIDDFLKTEIPKLTFAKLFEKSIYGELGSEVYKITKKLQRVKKAEVSKIKMLP